MQNIKEYAGINSLDTILFITTIITTWSLTMHMLKHEGNSQILEDLMSVMYRKYKADQKQVTRVISYIYLL